MDNKKEIDFFSSYSTLLQIKEILGIIFEFLDLEFLLQIVTRVNKKWNQVIRTTPSLWNSLQIMISVQKNKKGVIIFDYYDVILQSISEDNKLIKKRKIIRNIFNLPYTPHILLSTHPYLNFGTRGYNSLPIHLITSCTNLSFENFYDFYSKDLKTLLFTENMSSSGNTCQQKGFSSLKEINFTDSDSLFIVPHLFQIIEEYGINKFPKLTGLGFDKYKHLLTALHQNPYTFYSEITKLKLNNSDNSGLPPFIYFLSNLKHLILEWKFSLYVDFNNRQEMELYSKLVSLSLNISDLNLIVAVNNQKINEEKEEGRKSYFPNLQSLSINCAPFNYSKERKYWTLERFEQDFFPSLRKLTLFNSFICFFNPLLSREDIIKWTQSSETRTISCENHTIEILETFQVSSLSVGDKFKLSSLFFPREGFEINGKELKQIMNYIKEEKKCIILLQNMQKGKIRNRQDFLTSLSSLL